MKRQILGLDDLPKKGIKFSRQHIHKLIKKKKFPAPFKIAGTNAWTDDEIDRYIEGCIAKRDAAA